MHHLRKWATRKEARSAVIDYIERRRNRNRPHSTIGYKIPAKAMGALFERTEPSGVAATINARLEEMAAWKRSGILCPKS
jgi:putative transposase